MNERETLDYMDQNIRKISSIKSNVHMVNVVDSLESSQNDNEYVQLLKFFQDNQSKQNQIFNETLCNLSSMVNNLTIKQPVAGSDISHNSKYCIIHNSSTHELAECMNFKRMNHVQRLDFIRKNRMCFSCLSLGHFSAQCRNRKVCNIRDNNGNLCNKNHHPIMHEPQLNTGAQASYQYHSVSHILGNDIALLYFPLLIFIVTLILFALFMIVVLTYL